MRPILSRLRLVALAFFAVAAIGAMAMALAQPIDLLPETGTSVLERLQQFLVTALLGMASVAVAWLTSTVKSALSALAERQSNEAFKRLLEIVANTAATAVREVAQTAVNDLKAAHEDGRLTKAEALAALQAAKNRAWAILSDAVKQQLLDLVGGSAQKAIDTYVVPAIEAEVAVLDKLLPAAEPITDQATKDRVLQLARARLNLA